MNKIQEYRKKQNLRQADLAKKMNVSRTTVTKWESGKILPRSKLLPKLALVLKCNIDDLFCI